MLKPDNQIFDLENINCFRQNFVGNKTLKVTKLFFLLLWVEYFFCGSKEPSEINVCIQFRVSFLS